MTKIRSLCAALAVSGVVLVPGVSHAQPKPVELRYSSGAPPVGNPWVTQINRFAKDVEEESKGALKIQPFFASQLGSEQDTVQQVARGRIDMGGYSSGAAALLVPELALLTMPFYFKNTDELDCVLDNHMTKLVTDLFAAKGVRFAGWITRVCSSSPLHRNTCMRGGKPSDGVDMFALLREPPSALSCASARIASRSSPPRP